MKIPKNWAPMLIGVISTVMGVIQASTYGADWISALKDQKVEFAIILAILGFVSKQVNVTGGSVGQPSTQSALTDSNVEHSVVNPPIAK